MATALFRGCVRPLTAQIKRPPQGIFLVGRFYSTPRPLRPHKPRSEKRLARRFVDFKRIQVHGGKGGNGRLSFLSLPMNEWAGPDGGDGGNGGHIIFVASENEKSLGKVRSIYNGEDGANGRNKHCHGKNAEHIYVKVPVGTMFKNENQELLADLKRPGDIYVGARGGAGGKGNHFFLTNEMRAPMVYEEGAEGTSQKLLAELRVMAHAGMVGFPNAGKSTLLRAISRAKPKVAAYPFTTLNPHVGIVQYDDLEQVAVADIPGLINGAHLNYGLGFSFLRHIERCTCLLYVLDLSSDDPGEQLSDLKTELELYQAGLSQRPHAVVANKVDLPIAQQKLHRLKEQVSDMPIFAVSAKRKLHIEPLLVHLRQLYDAYGAKPN